MNGFLTPVTPALRSLLIPLLPITPIFEPQPSHEQVTETDFSTTTITLVSLPPNTYKADIRPVFQHFGEFKRIFVHPGGSRAESRYADVHGVKRTLHAYAEQPFCVCGWEIVVFRKHVKHGDKRSGVDVDSAWQGSSSRTSSYNPRTGQGRDDGAIFVSSFLADTMQQEMSEALVPFGKYDRLVMRMPSSFLRAVKFSDRDSSS